MAQTANMVGITRVRTVGIGSAYVQAVSSLQLHMNADFDSVFFNQNEFGTSVKYTHYRSGKTETYKEIFDDPSQNVKVGSSTEIMGKRPQVMLSTAHMKQVVNLNDIIVKNNIRYSVDSYANDGVGVITIYLILENQRAN